MTSRTAPSYSFAEEIANSISHGVGWMLSAGGLGLMATLAALTGDPIRVVSVSIFGATLILLYASSTMYHALPCHRAKRILRVFDHSAIYLLIAGTYTPLTLVALGGVWGWTLFAVIWSLAALGLVISIPAKLRLHWLEVVLYVAMGWLAIVALKPLLTALDTGSLVFLFSGGLAYTLGLIFYAWRSLPFGHLVWHLFVLAGSVLHFLAVLFAVVIA